MFAADPSVAELGQALQVLVYLMLGVGAILGIAVAWKTLRTRTPADEPITAANFKEHVAWVTEQNHARRNEANTNALGLAVIEKTLDNGLKRRVESLEQRQEVMAEKVDRCVFILEQEFGSKQRAGK